MHKMQIFFIVYKTLPNTSRRIWIIIITAYALEIYRYLIRKIKLAAIVQTFQIAVRKGLLNEILWVFVDIVQ